MNVYLLYSETPYSKILIFPLFHRLTSGSMTGAPKLRSVQLLDKLEFYTPRGVYSGCLGYISLPYIASNQYRRFTRGAAKFSVIIRTVVINSGTEVSVGAGGAILHLSDAKEEWDEVLVKSRAVIPRYTYVFNV